MSQAASPFCALIPSSLVIKQITAQKALLYSKRLAVFPLNYLLCECRGCGVYIVILWLYKKPSVKRVFAASSWGERRRKRICVSWKSLSCCCTKTTAEPETGFSLVQCEQVTCVGLVLILLARPFPRWGMNLLRTNLYQVWCRQRRLIANLYFHSRQWDLIGCHSLSAV